nr:retrovirus-related Pol polyprotein from transposon TNT 1-94 [Tanacetum cinerariifolium]
MGLWYPKDTGFELTAFSDSDHAGCLNSHKSTSGGIQFLGGDKLASWSSKKQDCTSMSFAEAEYVSLSACCAQVLWMRTQLIDYGFHFSKIHMYFDSKAAIAISCNPVHHLRTKHIDVRYHFIKEKVEKGIVELFFVGTEYQLADLFTKALPVERFKYLVRRLDSGGGGDFGGSGDCDVVVAAEEWGRRMVASSIWDRIDLVVGSIFGFGRMARRKTFSAAAVWWPTAVGGWPAVVAVVWGRWDNVCVLL